MRSEDDKADAELFAFNRFLDAIDGSIVRESIEKRHPPEPDISCVSESGEAIAFEVSELCDPQIAAAMSDPKATPSFFYTLDPTFPIAAKKRSKRYKTSLPIELLLYAAGKLITSDDTASRVLRDMNFTKSNYRRVWFLGEESVEEIYVRR